MMAAGPYESDHADGLVREMEARLRQPTGPGSSEFSWKMDSTCHCSSCARKVGKLTWNTASRAEILSIEMGLRLPMGRAMVRASTSSLVGSVEKSSS